MRRNRFVDGDGLGFKACVAMAVLCLHALFFQVLGYEPGRTAADISSATELRIEFIEAVRRPAPVEVPKPDAKPVAPAVTAPTRSAATDPKKPRSDAAPAPADAPARADEPARADAPLVMDWKQSGDAEPSYRMNLPDAAMPEALALNQPDRMHVRRKVTGQDVVEGVAQALGFWPPGYESDPCPRVQRNISALMTDTSADGRELLNEELRRQKVACRQ